MTSNLQPLYNYTLNNLSHFNQTLYGRNIQFIGVAISFMAGDFHSSFYNPPPSPPPPPPMYFRMKISIVECVFFGCLERYGECNITLLQRHLVPGLVENLISASGLTKFRFTPSSPPLLLLVLLDILFPRDSFILPTPFPVCVCVYLPSHFFKA